MISDSGDEQKWTKIKESEEVMNNGEWIAVQCQADEDRLKLQREWFNRGIRAAAKEVEQSNAAYGYVAANDILVLLKNPKGRK